MQQIYENNKSFSRKITNTLDWQPNLNSISQDQTLEDSTKFDSLNYRSQSTSFNKNFFQSVYSNISNSNNQPSHRLNNEQFDEVKIKDNL